MLSSATYSRDEGILNTGEQIAPEIDLKAPGLKVYYHQVKGAKTHLPDGAEIQFMGGMFATANEEIKAFLDKIADKRGSMVYTRKADAIVQELAQVASDAATPAGDSAKLNTPVLAVMEKAVTTPPERPKVAQDANQTAVK